MNTQFSHPKTTAPETHEIDPIFANLEKELQMAVKQLGFKTATPIQQQAIPLVASGKDILASSQTGSGKTAAFLLPIMNKILKDKDAERAKTGFNKRKTRALILTPTRELAAQICDHFQTLGKHTDLKCVAVFGGVSMLPQERAFINKVDIMVATPGRLLDHLSRSHGKLPGLEYLVLDEADRMLDMGFLPDIRRVIAALDKGPRQTLLFSATMPQPIVQLAGKMLNNPVPIHIERSQVTAIGIEHRAFKVKDSLKQDLLIQLIDKHQIKSAIIFTRTKHRTKRLAQVLSRQGIATECIHGNRSQLQRTKALTDFRKGKVQVLVATDVASRGIDVEAVSHVVNFDVPHMADDYIHRAGRTARADMTGYSYTLVSTAEMRDFRNIERSIKTPIKQVTLDGFDYDARPEEDLEIPLAKRLAEMRAYKAACRARAEAKRTPRSNDSRSSRQPSGDSARPAERSGSDSTAKAEPAKRNNSRSRTRAPKRNNRDHKPGNFPDIF